MTGRGEAFAGHLRRIIFAVLVFVRSWKSLYVVCLICGTQDTATESKDFQRLGRWLFVKCLVCKHENMNLGSRNPCEKPGLVGSLVIQNWGK